MKTNKAFIPQVKVFFPDFYVDLSSSEKLKKEEEIMYRFKYEKSQDKLIAALEEISFLKDLLLKKVGSQTKKVG